LASLKQRPTGVRLVVIDAHVGLISAVGRMFQGCSWQRCRVHFARNLLRTVPKAQQEKVAAALRSVFTQHSATAVEEQWDQVVAMLADKFPSAAELMASAREVVLSFCNFPVSHWRKLWSANLLERVNEEIKRRTLVVGIFPDNAAITPLDGAVLPKQGEYWQLESRRICSLVSMSTIPAAADELPLVDPAATA
jgi:putative transposase